MANTFIFRKATLLDAPQCLCIIEQAKVMMHEANNFQWGDTYPLLSDIHADIMNGYAYVLATDTEVAAYGAVVFDGEPTYKDIKGKWLTDGEFVVLHRLAVSGAFLHQGLASRYFDEIEKLALSKGITSFKIDTNDTNLPMQATLKKRGFVYTGNIEFEGAPRLAFEKILKA